MTQNLEESNLQLLGSAKVSIAEFNVQTPEPEQHAVYFDEQDKQLDLPIIDFMYEEDRYEH